MIVVYITDKSWTAVSQLYNPAGLVITKKMNQVGEAKFELPNSHEDCNLTSLKKMNRIKITQEYLGDVSTYFEGVISATVSSLYKTTVVCKDRLHILERRNLPSDYSANTSISTILSTILASINGVDDTGMTLNCSIATTKNVSYTKDTNFLQVLRDVSKGIEFLANWDEIQVATTIWTDISGTVELRYDISNLGDRNISDVNVEDDSNNLANKVTVKGTTTSVEFDSASITAYGELDSSFSVDGDSASEAISILAERKDGARNITIQPLVNDFFLAEVGDTVAINVLTETDLVYFTGTMRVIEKRLEGWDADRVKYVLWNNKLKTKNFLEKQKDVEERLKKLELA